MLVVFCAQFLQWALVLRSNLIYVNANSNYLGASFCKIEYMCSSLFMLVLLLLTCFFCCLTGNKKQTNYEFQIMLS